MNPYALATSTLAVYILSPFAAIAALLALTRILTTINYWRSLRDFKDNGGKQVVHSPQLPYTIPFIGNAFQFMGNQPGVPYRLFPRSTGVCSVLMGGMKTHILYSPTVIQALFRSKSATRDVFEVEMFSHVLAMPMEQIEHAEATKQNELELNSKYLFNFERVNELTSHFITMLESALDEDAEHVVSLDKIGLYEWLRKRMFTASCNTLFGEKLLEMYPDYCEDFFEFDSDLLSFFFRLPGIIMREANTRRAKIFDKLEKWGVEMWRQSGGSPIDPDGPSWEPIMGSRLNRARHLDYRARGLNIRSAAALDAGITFALMSNVIPVTGWMLFSVLDPNAAPDVLPRVLAEINRAKLPDGSLDVTALVSSPLLQSIFIETLRLNSDVLVTRNLTEDILLPLDEDGKRHVAFRKGDNVFAPSWLEHRDPDATWGSSKVAPDVFDADRFIVKDPKTGEESFSMARTAGRFFPFGGGKTICPGRNFAKQEAIGGLATVLLRFEFEVKYNVDAEKKPTKDFPAFKRAFPGTGALAPGGDMVVKISRRT
ncbi:uncharacterized protein RCC_07260 [Ramularia collo-cygni]|uniref:Cytochrome P450 n=1 Tax=Ramularia collo-cygni TaxID=112498 RepID=A0A2D3V9G0_9PEZI|nr:uncharacterized protein RCC_07260 [Ramularia collo-cygni]CZT21397.1 uncharacterized protein RCC_07260 [Ramularia collo-cygni]